MNSNPLFSAIKKGGALGLLFLLALLMGCPSVIDSKLLVTYTITSGGSVKIDPAFKSRALMNYNEEILFTALPEEGYSSAWSIEGGAFSAGGKYGDLTAKVKVSADIAVTLSFYKKMEISQLSDYLEKAPEGVVSFIEITKLEATDLFLNGEISPLNKILRRHLSKKVALKLPAKVEGATSMESAFFDCTNLIGVVDIPEGITNMTYAFQNCTNLEKAPTLPEGVLDLRCCFIRCTKLVETPRFPESITNLENCFAECASLKKVSALPSSLVSIDGCFYACLNLEESPVIPNSVKTMNSTFYNCVSLTKMPALPENLINLNSCFNGCSQLVEASGFPKGLKEMNRTFQNCVNLQQVSDIPETVLDLQACFYGCKTLKSVTLLCDFNSRIDIYGRCFFCGLFDFCPSLDKESIKVPTAFLSHYVADQAIREMFSLGITSPTGEKKAKFVGF